MMNYFGDRVGQMSLSDHTHLKSHENAKKVCHEDIGGSGGIAPPFSTSALDGGESQATRSSL
jgi:hypothetical protein